METSTLQNTDMVRTTARKHITNQSKSNKIINFSIFSGTIYNLLYKENKEFSETEITLSPGVAFFDKESQALGAL